MNNRCFVPVILAAAACSYASPTVSAAESWFTWTTVAPLPSKTAKTGAFVGLLDGIPIIAGGYDCANERQSGKNVLQNGIFSLRSDTDGKYRWKMVGRLKAPLARGAAASSAKRLIFLGGRDARGLSDGVFLLRWHGDKNNVQISDLPRLPMPCEYPAAAVLENRLYVAGGNSDRGAMRRFWVLDLSASQAAESRAAWRELPAWPGEKRFGASLIAQSDGERNCLFMFGGRAGNKYFKEAYRFDPLADNAKGRWISLADMPRAAASAPAVPWGESHVLIFHGDLLAYHTITDTWTAIGALPKNESATAALPWRNGLFLSAGERGNVSREECRATEVLFGKPAPFEASFGPLDHAALAVYLIAMVLIGFYFTGREKTSGDFLLGGRRIPWWAAGLSLLATQVSSIGFMAIPAKTYATNWVYFTGVGTWFLVVPLVNRAYIPFFRRLNVTSAYEYLELRFHLVARLFGTLVYSFMQLGRMAIVLCLPALAFSAVTGIDTDVSILLMGVVCTAYTVAGGIEAVIWTEVVQAALLLAGGLICVVMVIVGIDGGPARFFEIAMADHKFQMVQLDWSYATASLWVVVLGNVFTRLGGLTADQAIVQRYLTTPDEAEAKRALWTDVAVGIPWALIVFTLGTALYVFYKLHPDMLSATLHTDAVVPLFIAQKIPTGLSGLVIAAVFAAAMSTLQSSMHSVATIWVADVYVRFIPRSSDRSRLNMARLFTLLLGVFGTGTALWMASSDIKSLWDQSMIVANLFIGSLTGMFILGIFTRRTGAVGLMVGATASAAVLFYVVYFTRVSFFLYSAIGCITCCVVGYIFSLVMPARRLPDGLTIYDLKSTESDRRM